MRILSFWLMMLLCQITFGQSNQIDSLLNVVSRKGKDTGTVIAYRALAGMAVNFDLEQGRRYAREGIILGKAIGYDKGVAGCYLNLSSNFATSGKLDSALIYNDTTLIWSLKVGEPARIGLSYLNRSDLKMRLENFPEALAFSDSAMVYAELAGKDDLRARVLHTIGSIYFVQDNYPKSKSYYEKAFNLYRSASNSRMMGIILNNLGNVNKHLKNYDGAIQNFREALKFAEKVGDKISPVMYYSNLSDVYIEKDEMGPAEENALISLKLARESNSEESLASTQLVLAKIYLKTRRASAARTSALEALSIAEQNRILEKQEMATGLLADACSLLKDYKGAFEYSRKNKTLSDSLSQLRYQEEVLSLQTRYEVNEKEARIELLSKENQLQFQKLYQNRLLAGGAVVTTLLAFASIVLLISRHKSRQRIGELELRTRIASDLHDEVGSSLSSIHLLTQLIRSHPDHPKKNQLFDTMIRNVKETVDTFTDIVWVVKPGEEERRKLSQRMERFAYDICSANDIELELKIRDESKDQLSMQQRKNLYLVFKEAVNNAAKYSGTKKLLIELQSEHRQLLLRVSDFGGGFDQDQVTEGNGIGNMQTRAAELGAELRIKSVQGEGTTLELCVDTG